MTERDLKPAVSYGRRAASYWFVDGLPETLFGLALVVFAAWAFLLRMYAPKPWSSFDVAIFYAGLILYCLTERGILDFLKGRFTYPHTGYVHPPEESEWRVEPLTILRLRPDPPAKENVTFFRLRTMGPVFLVFALFWANGHPAGRWVVPSVTSALALTLYFANRKSERPYRWWSALILALTGLVFLWVDVPAPLQGPLPFLLAGVWLAAQGVRTLVHYLRINPYPAAAEGARA
jgi:hypothetical protein